MLFRGRRTLFQFFVPEPDIWRVPVFIFCPGTRFLASSGLQYFDRNWIFLSVPVLAPKRLFPTLKPELPKIAGFRPELKPESGAS